MKLLSLIYHRYIQHYNTNSLSGRVRHHIYCAYSFALFSWIQARQLPKVNKFLAERLLAEQDGDESMLSSSKKNKKNKKREAGLDAVNPMTDDRFSSMFTNKDFELDRESEQYVVILILLYIPFSRKRSKRCIATFLIALIIVLLFQTFYFMRFKI